MITKILNFLGRVVFGSSELPIYPYGDIDGDSKKYKIKGCHTTVYLFGCHFSSKLGEYVYWTYSIDDYDSKNPFPVPQSYLREIL